VVRLREWFKRRSIGVKELELSSMKRMSLGWRMGEKGRRGKVLRLVLLGRSKEQGPSTTTHLDAASSSRLNHHPPYNLCIAME
jgi:hypothetical protein